MVGTQWPMERWLAAYYLSPIAFGLGGPMWPMGRLLWVAGHCVVEGLGKPSSASTA